MSHSCGDESHSDGHDHDHSHDHDRPGLLGHADNLSSAVDIDNIVALNTEGTIKDVFRPWHQRLSDQRVESCDEPEIIVRVPFTGSVNLKAILLRVGPGEQTPSSVSLFTNREDIDFTNVEEFTPVQALNIARGNDVGEYSLSRAKFTNVTSITLLIKGSYGADNNSVYWIGFLGTFIAMRKGAPTNIVYEASPNLADHTRIKGTDGGFSSLGM